MRKKKQFGKWVWLLLLLVLIIGALVFLEWLGSEQPQKMLEQPVQIQAPKTKTE